MGIPMTDYEALKQKAIDLTMANQLIEAIINLWRTYCWVDSNSLGEF
jgi:hypothetical protein